MDTAKIGYNTPAITLSNYTNRQSHVVLTGGSGGVFATTYSVKGSSDDPIISSNPLSVLTPGILRRIFEPC